jgi:hypothetical protein
LKYQINARGIKYEKKNKDHLDDILMVMTMTVMMMTVMVMALMMITMVMVME